MQFKKNTKTKHKNMIIKKKELKQVCLDVKKTEINLNISEHLNVFFLEF